MENIVEIRELNCEELIELEKLSTTLFRSKNEKLKDEEAYKKILLAEAQKSSFDFFRLGAFCDDKLCAAIINNDYIVNFDGNECKMSGIGGVVSDFNSPVKGLMKKINMVAFEKMRKNKQFISHLYPFEESYYRKYGYEVSAEISEWNIPVEKIENFKNGIVLAYDGSDKMKFDIINLYEAFSKDKNLSVKNTQKNWEAFFEEVKAYVTDLKSFLHYDNDGNCDAYMNYNIIYHEHKPQDLKVNKLWYKNFKALGGLLSYFITQRLYCDKIFISLPTTVDISPFLNSTGGWGKRNVTRYTINSGLSRIVDVEEILKIATFKNEGEICIKIYDDDYAPWNNDCFNVKYGKETTKVERGGKPDIEMKISSFSAGILGRFDFENLKIFPDIKIINNIEFGDVFYKKHLFIEEHF